MSEARVALVTGSGSRRIGWYVAEALAARGYRLALHYRTSSDEAAAGVEALRKRGVDAVAFGANLGNEQEARGLVQHTLARFGRIDVLVNCAAVWKRKRLDRVTGADLLEHFGVNALGTFVCSQQAGLAMVRQPEGGCIINLGDWAVVRPYKEYLAYFASKGAVEALTRALAVELAARNPRVRVNCVQPGPVLLPPELSEAERQQSIRGTLAKHEGRPEDVARAVLFFIDSDFVTGVCLPVDGGRSIYAPEGDEA
jgi:pteridine reductase